MQCGICSNLLEEPTTLPCGQSLCKRCIPEAHVRTNISWPATASRRHGFTCPFLECGRQHAVGDCSIDVSLNKALTNIRSAIEEVRDAVEASDVATHVTRQDQWDVAGLPSLQEKEHQSQVLKGGKIWATYDLVGKGQLGYSCEVTYSSVGATDVAVDEIDSALFLGLKEMTRTEMDCQVCYALFYDPLTTACGHTFCRTCLHRVVDHSAYCPICRRTLSIQPQLQPGSFPSNHRLTSIIEGFWSDILNVRAEAIRIELQSAGDFDLPLFVVGLSFPHMPMFLHVFEPRYRLMIRRAMETTRTFGMVTYKEPTGTDDASFEEIGTLLYIRSIEFFPDGRSLLETIGISRFRVTRHGQRDGYTVANVEKIDDISLAEEEEMEIRETMPRGVQDFAQQHNESASPPSPTAIPMRPRSSGSPTISVEDLETMATRELLEFGMRFVRRMRARSASWLAARTLAIYGECPDDPALFSWWLASVLPVTEEERLRLLVTSSVRQRLKICCRWAIEWESSRW
jgi:hypothetical protein